MTITAQIIADSISPEGIRLTTMQLRYPRFIHAEFMTHRVFSRNASSSRAIPVQRMIEDLRRNPAIPVFWGSNKPGMQAGEQLKCSERIEVERLWAEGMENAISIAEEMMNAGLHKQIANRILEPWAHVNVLVTATEWNNFFELRAHSDAQPEIHALALEMFNAMAGSQPKHLKPGEWHLPYITRQDYFDVGHYFRNEKQVNITDDRIVDLLRKISVARCARVSYLTHDGQPTTVEQDRDLYEKLIVQTPIHASPTEHIATPDKYASGYQGEGACWHKPKHHGNFRGWIQMRKIIESKFEK